MQQNFVAVLGVQGNQVIQVKLGITFSCSIVGVAGPTLVGIIPYAGLKFYIYEDLKSHVPEQYQKSVVLRLSCGALAGLFGQTLTYPLDVIRRQMQALYHLFTLYILLLD